MKNSILAASLAAVMLMAPTTQVQAADIAQNLCNYISADDKKRLRSFLKTNKLKIRGVFKGVACNGMDLLAFADSRGSVETGSLIIAKLPKKIVPANMGSVSNPELLAAAKKRIG